MEDKQAIGLTRDDLMCIYLSLFLTITNLKECKRCVQQRYGELYDERYEISIQGYTTLAEKIFDMMED